MKTIRKKVGYFTKIILLLLLVFITFSYAMFQGGFVSWFLFFSFLPFALYSLFIYFYPIHKITVKREIRDREFTEGESIQVSLTVTFPRQLPLFFIVLTEDMPEKLNSKLTNPYKFILFSFFKKQLEMKYEINHISRGEYRLNGFHVKVHDWFGFIEKNEWLPYESIFLVYPSVVKIAYQPFENLDQGMVATRDKVQRDTTMAISVREYQPGDRFSWINWKASARKNELMTKEFEQRQTNDILIVLDCSPSRTFDLAVKFTASLIQAVLKKGAQVGLYAFEKERKYFPVQGGEIQQQTLFYFLAKVEDQAEIEWYKQIQNEPVIYHQNITKILITTELRKEDLDTISKIATKRGTVLLFCIKDHRQQISDKEVHLREIAKKRGVNVRIIHEEDFANAFIGGIFR